MSERYDRARQGDHATSIGPDQEAVIGPFDGASLSTTAKVRFSKVFSLSSHDASTSRCILLNASSFPSDALEPGGLMSITSLQPIQEQSSPVGDEITAAGQNKREGHGQGYLFRAEVASSEQLSRMPHLQVSVPPGVATAFRLSKSIPVTIATADEVDSRASHVEIVFRDQYLTRGDMWRLIHEQLVGQCMHRDQKIDFMGTIKAVIRTIFVKGTKVNSAIFHASTKPIFRSESARYVLFIQMSKEMWEFDAEGTGEIMFDKVVNGFLPELFKRWKEMQVRHLVTIILFTRMEYRDKVPPRNGQSAQILDSKDFYRVVASDMTSFESANLLDRLKREFQIFLKDVSTRRPTVTDFVPLDSGLSAASTALPELVVAGQPSAASQGNVLEAINLASSQFSSDYIDRDLIRTGVSVVVITPGTGSFEVDYGLLIATTENLTDNGVGIDLVCLSRMPLHSVPLFKYQQPAEPGDATNASGSLDADQTPTRSYSNTMNFGTPTSSTLAKPDPSRKQMTKLDLWSYGIPHWVDVSYWTSINPTDPSVVGKTLGRPKASLDSLNHKPFRTRVRMYELQMMGVMENATNDIAIPLLPQQSGSDHYDNQSDMTSASSRLKPSTSFSISPVGSFGLQGSGSGAQTPRASSPPHAAGAGTTKARFESLFWMEKYDNAVFRHPAKSQKQVLKQKSSRIKSKKRSTINGTKKSLPSEMSSRTREDSSGHQVSPVLSFSRSPLSRQPSTVSADSEDVLDPRTKRIKPELGSRKISIGPRGLGVRTKTGAVAIATTDVPVGHESRQSSSLLTAGIAGMNRSKSSQPEIATQSGDWETRTNIVDTIVESSQEDSLPSEDSEREGSKPIPIRAKIGGKVPGRKKYTDSLGSSKLKSYDRIAVLKDVRHLADSDADDNGDMTYGPNLPTLSSSTLIAPWITVLNPCNPSTSVLGSTRLGRWHHVFPRPLKASQIKWKSLCSPAAVPLTTEEFPTTEQLADEYREKSYTMSLPEEMDVSDRPRSLANELLAFRLSRGFQIVIGDQVANAIDEPSLRIHDIFNAKVLIQPGSSVWLSRGGTIHCLNRLAPDKIQVKTFSRHKTLRVIGLDDDAYLRYTPQVRSMLAETYEHKVISTAPQRGNFDWEYMDAFIAGHERPVAEQYIESLRPWRARFVLIPIETPPTNYQRSGQAKELTDEETRLEGIKKLTQLWQKCSYVSPEERRFKRRTRCEEDVNPLDVQYFTKNPSAVIAEELDSAIIGPTTEPVQLLPETEMYQRSGYDMRALAEKLQGDKGVRMVDRRWHLKLHHHCLVGSELTTWLLENFRDVCSREDAIDLGNEVMNKGLFKHVERRHEFRDGHYFYQILDDYRIARPESKGFFGWVKQSIPPTPIKELSSTVTVNHEAPTSRADGDSMSDGPPSSAIKQTRSTVALGKSLIYNLVHNRSRVSYREEVMTIHYDRLHNPENCYHIRLEWMNTTPKLIQDAVNHWAMVVEAYGLRLVEVPIGEASSIASMHPFRAPYLIELAAQPPERSMSSNSRSTSLPNPDFFAQKQFYQKGILRRFNFVLDFEAAADFPPDVEVTYSWGKPDYRHPQYIHRSGLLIAQITHGGSFLILANRLYNNKSSSARKKTFNDQSDPRADRSPMVPRNTPLRAGDGLTQRASPRSSPFSSPVVRAALDVPNTNTPSRSPLSNTPPLRQRPQNSSSSSSTVILDPEVFTREFEEFCSDKEALEAFYAEQARKRSSPAPKTPTGQRIPTPERRSDSHVDEHGIPDLALPSSLAVDTAHAHSGRSGRQLGSDVGDKGSSVDAIGLKAAKEA